MHPHESAGVALMKGVAITYGDVAPEAKENFAPSASEQEFNTLANLQKNNMQVYNYASPCELYQTLLDGSAVPLPDNAENANIGLWSKQLSNDDGTFAEPITITLESEGQYSSQGFTFTFDKFNDIFPTRLTIQWYRVVDDVAEDLTGEIEFNPTSGFYFCRNQVENFNKVIIKFYSLNMPQNRLKVEVIDYGYGTVFYGDSLRNVQLAQSIDPLSSEIKINTCDFTIDSHVDMEYSFQVKQPLSVTYNDKLLATVFVKTATRKSRYMWEVNAEDYIGIMNNVPFIGGMYNNVAAGEIVEEIFTVAKVPYSIDGAFYDMPLSGHIQYTTCRDALMQVCFACMATVNTANSDIVEVKTLEDDVKQIIPLERIMQGQSFEDSDTVTGVELTAHTYTESLIEERLYIAADSGIGENIVVMFSEPMYHLEIGEVDDRDDEFYANDSFGEIIEGNCNYAIINAKEGCVLAGRKYKHATQIRRKKSTTVLASELDNLSQITEATLISTANVDAVLDNCYDQLAKSRATNMRIVVGKDIEREARNVTYGEAMYGACRYGGTIINEVVTEQQDVQPGEVLTTETEYLGEITGRLTSQSFNLNGNIIVKEVVLK